MFKRKKNLCFSTESTKQLLRQSLLQLILAVLNQMNWKNKDFLLKKTLIKKVIILKAFRKLPKTYVFQNKTISSKTVKKVKGPNEGSFFLH